MFSLSGVLIVVVILGVIAIVAVPEVRRAQVRSKATSETGEVRKSWYESGSALLGLPAPCFPYNRLFKPVRSV